MPLPRAALDENLARVNAARPADLAAKLVEADEQKFKLSFPERTMPEGQCIDQDFTEIQWKLHEHANVTTSIIGARLDEDEQRYLVEYEVVEWD